METSELAILATAVCIILAIFISVLLYYITKLRRELQQQQQVSSIITGPVEPSSTTKITEGPRKNATLYDGLDVSASSSSRSLYKTFTASSTMTNASPLRSSTTEQDLQQHLPELPKSPKRLNRPRISLGLILKNMTTSRPNSITSPTSVNRDETVIDQRKVFALPGFLQIETIDHNIELTDPIAKGSFGDIWKGQLKSEELLAKNHGRPYCAVKIAIDDLNTEERHIEILKAFRQEVTIIHTLSPHPNIISLIGYSETPDRDLIIVEELCDYSLSDLIHKHLEERLLVDDLFVIFAGIVDGLSWMHRHGVIHNDLKPQNVLINTRGSLNFIEPTGLRRVKGFPESKSHSSLVYTDSETSAFITIWENLKSPRYLPKICDMGVTTIDTPASITPIDKKRRSLILEAMQSHGIPQKTRDPRISRTITEKPSALSNMVAPNIVGEQRSAVKGFSVRYASPEQVKFMDSVGSKEGEGQDQLSGDFITRSKSDIWPLGIIIWEMMERKHPYVEMTKEEIKISHMNNLTRPLEFKTEDSTDSYLSRFLKEKSQLCMQIKASSRPSSETLLQNCLSASTKATEIINT